MYKYVGRVESTVKNECLLKLQVFPVVGPAPHRGLRRAKTGDHLMWINYAAQTRVTPSSVYLVPAWTSIGMSSAPDRNPNSPRTRPRLTMPGGGKEMHLLTPHGSISRRSSVKPADLRRRSS
ncbi:hypothetical protein PoB_001894300 [Plakobranchus ocellatus]|uniref:Uncharacterized protein n=1 Tax=Plakobranchus ocellatus TaxID=259542 RepID=A0AAV3ZDB2_9GAST|nr:hypothetical protein PoB_001894300 [Plakobranchus ocellatus]